MGNEPSGSAEVGLHEWAVDGICEGIQRGSSDASSVDRVDSFVGTSESLVDRLQLEWIQQQVGNALQVQGILVMTKLKGG